MSPLRGSSMAQLLERALWRLRVRLALSVLRLGGIELSEPLKRSIAQPTRPPESPEGARKAAKL